MESLFFYKKQLYIIGWSKLTDMRSWKERINWSLKMSFLIQFETSFSSTTCCTVYFWKTSKLLSVVCDHHQEVCIQIFHKMLFLIWKEPKGWKWQSYCLALDVEISIWICSRKPFWCIGEMRGCKLWKKPFHSQITF